MSPPETLTRFLKPGRRGILRGHGVCTNLSLVARDRRTEITRTGLRSVARVWFTERAGYLAMDKDDFLRTRFGSLKKAGQGKTKRSRQFQTLISKSPRTAMAWGKRHTTVGQTQYRDERMVRGRQIVRIAPKRRRRSTH